MKAEKNNVEEEAEWNMHQEVIKRLGWIQIAKYDTDVYASYDDVSDIKLKKSWLPSYL